jgi:tetratricopeptide (TPR) repeat protein
MVFHRKKNQRDENDRREDILRPSRYLGYDRDSLGVYLLSREAYEIAETQFRRAVWLNPFEPEFKKHHALCLYRLGRYPEALELLSKLSESEKKDEGSHLLFKLIEDKLKQNSEK